MSWKLLNVFLVLSLHHFFAESVFATSCVIFSPERELELARLAATNQLYKGFYIGLILAAFVGNLVLARINTKRWLLTLALMFASIPLAGYYLVWEVVNSGCDNGGLAAAKYLFVLIPLVLILLFQTKSAFRSFQLIKADFE